MKTRLGFVGAAIAVVASSALSASEARASAFVWPASGRIATTYLSSHKAIDISNASGTPIYASRGGNLWLQNYQSGYGYYVKIDHDAGYRTVYARLRGFYGGRRWVRQGDQVGYMGRSGAANGVNHIHWVLQRWGVPQYVPATYLRWVWAKSGINWKYPGL